MICRRPVLFALLLISVLGACAKPKYMRITATPIPVPQAKANVVFIRPANFGSAIRFMILDDQGTFVGESISKSHFVTQVDPGRHLFVAWSENTSALEATVEAGKTYYVHVQPTMGAFKAQVQLKAIKPGSEKWSDLEEWLKDTRRMEIDGDLGQAYLSSKSEKVQKRIATANEKWNEGYSAEQKAERTLSPEDGR